MARSSAATATAIAAGLLAAVTMLAGLPLLAGPAGAADAGGGFAGTPIEPGPSAQQPTVLASGAYTFDVTAADRDGYVAIDQTVPGSHFWYGLSLVTGERFDASKTLYVQSEPDGDDHAPCAGYESIGNFDSAESRFATTLFWSGRTPGCRRAHRLVLRLRDSGLTGTVQLVLWEEPPLVDESVQPKPGAVSWAPLEPAAEAERLTPGTTYADAPTLPDGTYSVHVDPGEPALFRVPLTWGQHAQVQATSDTRSGGGIAEVRGRWLTPLGGSIATTTFAGGGPDRTSLDLDGQGDPAGWVTPVVAWRNRYGAHGPPAAFAGDYYLSIDTREDQVPAAGVDLVLTAETVTDFPGKHPDYTATPPVVTYVDGTTPPDSTAETTVGATAGTDRPAAGSGGSGDDGSALVAFGLFGAAALLVVAGTVALTRRRAIS